MGGTTKASMSDVMEVALEAYVRWFYKKHGAKPVTEKDRRDFVKRLAAFNQAELVADLHDLD
jgi:hypothetical protein